MSNALTDLKTYVKAGARTNRFEMEISGTNVGTDFAKELKVLCKSASFPTRTVQVTSISRYGRKYNLRSETEYSGNFDITVIEDPSLTVRYTFDKLMYLVDNSRISSGSSSTSSYEYSITGPSDDYTLDITIWQLDGAGNKVYGYKLEHAFPVSMGEVQFSSDSENGLVEYNISFTYSEFIPLRNSSASVNDTAV